MQESPKAKPKAKKPARKPSGTPRRRKGVKLRPTELGAADLAIENPSPALAALAEAIRADGGAVLASYREPLGGHALLFAALPVAQVAPTPFQRDISDAHVRRLTQAMDKTRRFLDPIIVVREPTEGARYWTPNGYHRLTALKELDAKSVLALVVPERAVAYQILALNIEKAHNLRERAIGVRRMYEDLLGQSEPSKIASGEGELRSSEPIAGGSGLFRGPELGESDYALEFEEPALATLGFAYEERGRISGGAYHAVLKRADGWLPGRLVDALPQRRARAALLLDYDDAVTAAMTALKARGFTSPYLRSFVVARTNPLRFIKGDAPPLEELLPSMAKRARAIDVGKIKSEDLARAGGAPEGAE